MIFLLFLISFNIIIKSRFPSSSWYLNTMIRGTSPYLFEEEIFKRVCPIPSLSISPKLMYICVGMCVWVYILLFVLNDFIIHQTIFTYLIIFTKCSLNNV